MPRDPFAAPDSLLTVVLLSYSLVFLLLVVLPCALLGLAFAYAVLRLRDAQNRRQDPQLGFKAAMHFFFSLSLLVILTGLTILAVDFIWDLDIPGIRKGQARLLGNRGDFPNSMQRTGLAFLAAGALFLLTHLIVILTLTRDQGPSVVRRVFLGWRFAIHGIVVLFGLTVLLVVLFQKSEAGTDEIRRILIGVLLVWLPSWFFHFVLLRASSPPPVAERFEPGD